MSLVFKRLWLSNRWHVKWKVITKSVKKNNLRKNTDTKHTLSTQNRTSQQLPTQGSSDLHNRGLSTPWSSGRKWLENSTCDQTGKYSNSILRVWRIRLRRRGIFREKSIIWLLRESGASKMNMPWELKLKNSSELWIKSWRTVTLIVSVVYFTRYRKDATEMLREHYGRYLPQLAPMRRKYLKSKYAYQPSNRSLAETWINDSVQKYDKTI